MMASWKALAAAVVLAIANGCAATGETPAAATGGPQLLRNGDFESDPDALRPCPPLWWCAVHANPAAFDFALATQPGSAGRFLKVTRVKPEPWAMVSQALPAAGLAGKRVRLSVAVNAEGLDGGAGPMILLQGTAGRVLDHRKALLTRGPGWRRASTEIVVVPGTELVEFSLLVEGGGWVGFDGASATVLSTEGR